MTDEIEVHELRTLAVSSDGTAFRIGCKTVDDAEYGLVFRSDTLRALMLSLFRAADTAFKRLLDDPSARLVYPVTGCRLQSAAGGGQNVLVLQSADGFEAAFALAPETLAQLAEVVMAHTSDTCPHPLHLN